MHLSQFINDIAQRASRRLQICRRGYAQITNIMIAVAASEHNFVAHPYVSIFGADTSVADRRRRLCNGRGDPTTKTTGRPSAGMRKSASMKISSHLRQYIASHKTASLTLVGKLTPPRTSPGFWAATAGIEYKRRLS
jgi:hypothetical protein